MSKRRFDETKIPAVKDHMKGPCFLSNQLMEESIRLLFVDYTVPFLQAGIFPNYRLNAELYVPSEEQIQTNIREIDDANLETYAVEIPLRDIEGKFALHEVVIGEESGMKANVKKFYIRKKKIRSSTCHWQFQTCEKITRQTPQHTSNTLLNSCTMKQNLSSDSRPIVNLKMRVIH